MQWEDERYVRVYTRDTPDWIALGWEAQALLVLVLRKCDRDGVLEMGKSGRRGLAALVHMPHDVVTRALDVLLEDGCVRQEETRLVVRNFVAAQETPSSGAKRMRDYRERERERARSQPDTALRPVITPFDEAVTPNRRPSVTKSNGAVTFRHQTLRVETRGDERLREVTLCCAMPSRTVPNQDPPVVPPSGGTARATRGIRLPEDWSPSEATVRRFRERERVDALASLERFKNHWLAKSGRSATKTDWERTFANWVLEDIDRGKAKPCETVHEARLPEAPPDALSPADATAHFEQLESELLGAGKLPWDPRG